LQRAFLSPLRNGQVSGVL